MTERPILFQGPMIRALLANTKTQTRRVVKPQPRILAGELLCWKDDALTPEEMAQRCPAGQPGDRLWVREAWGYIDPDCTGDDVDERAGPAPGTFCDELLQEGHPLRDFWRRRVAYRATWEDPKYGAGPDAPKRWRPSIHMPRWASRITLEVTGVRVERLQSISEADAIAEGCHGPDDDTADNLPNCPQCGGTGLYTAFNPATGGALPDTDCRMCDTPVGRYRILWESINGPGSWDANPWVWVVEFKRVTP